MKILGYEYRIEQKATVAEIDATARLLTRKQVIQIASDLTEENTISTLLHEILEALNYHLELKLEHKVIMALEAGLFQTLVANGVDLSPLDGQAQLQKEQEADLICQVEQLAKKGPHDPRLVEEGLS